MGTEKNGRVGAPQAVVVHASARDRYQLAQALYEKNLLRALVTNVYSASAVAERYGVTIPGENVRLSSLAGGAYLVNRVFPRLLSTSISDGWLGTKARRVAAERGDAVLACSYYGFNAFKPGADRPEHRILFQLHPHPVTVRRTLLDEVEKSPEARDSLVAEMELSIGSGAFNRLASEAGFATGCIAASSHTARTLVENGVDKSRIRVVPYGVCHENFPQRSQAPIATQPFVVIFVGSLVQRKGLKYLLDAIRLLGSKQIRLKLRGRGVCDERLLKSYSDLDLDIVLGASQTKIVEDLHASDLFALPSLEEGFAHVLLEAMSCGLPILSTDRTCAPDVIDEGREGFVVEAGNSAILAERIHWAVEHRRELADMGNAAAQRARGFTWEKFRQGVRSAYVELTKSESPIAQDELLKNCYGF